MFVVFVYGGGDPRELRELTRSFPTRLSSELSRGVIRDWLRSGRHGGYRMPGLPADIEQRLRAVRVPVFAMHFAHDAFGPERALHALLDKRGSGCESEIHGLDTPPLGVHANHFAWLKQPDAEIGSA